MRYKANVPHANLLGTNPWIDFKADMPVVLDKVKLPLKPRQLSSFCSRIASWRAFTGDSWLRW